MIVFHLFWNLDSFGYLDLDMKDQFWKFCRNVIVSMFLITVGISLALANTSSINWSKIGKRTLILAGASLLVSIGSYTQFPNSWIYFGILHFILVASLVGLLFLNRPVISFLTAIVIFLGTWQGWLHTRWLFDMFDGFLPSYTVDLARFFPWFGVVLIGMVIFHYGLHNKFFKVKKLSFLGRHSLLIYMIHQPILFGLLYII